MYICINQKSKNAFEQSYKNSFEDAMNFYFDSNSSDSIEFVIKNDKNKVIFCSAKIKV